MGSLSAQSTDCGVLDITNVQYLGSDLFKIDVELNNGQADDCYAFPEFRISLPFTVFISPTVASGVELTSSVSGTTITLENTTGDATIPAGVIASITFLLADDGCVQTAIPVSNAFICNSSTPCDNGGPSVGTTLEICNTFLNVSGEVYSPVPGMETAQLPEFSIRSMIGNSNYDHPAIFELSTTENIYVNEGIPTVAAQEDGFTRGLIDPTGTELTLPDVADECGVHITDLIDTRRLILDIEGLDGWQRIAADASQNGMVSTQDIVIVARIILGLELDPFDYSVRFPTPLNLATLDDLPAASIDASYSGRHVWEPLNDSQTDVDFAAVKLGDVTGDCFLLAASDDPMNEQDTTRLTSTIDFTIVPISGTTDRYETKFYAADFDTNSILSMEFLLNSGFEIVSITDGAVDFTSNNHVLKSTNESLKFIYVDSTYTGPSTLMFTAEIKQTDPAADALQAINPAPANGFLGELYVGEDVNGNADIRNLTLNRIVAAPSSPATIVNGNATFFPNPANEVLNYRFSQPFATDATLKVISISGRKLLEVLPEPSATFGTINIRSLPKGMYVLATELKDGSIVTHRFTKQ